MFGDSSDDDLESLFEPSCSNGIGLQNAPDEYFHYDNENGHALPSQTSSVQHHCIKGANYAELSYQPAQSITESI
jgi:hypothetical protein